jgi:peptidyl-prolyl cis-trans isomerase C
VFLLSTRRAEGFPRRKKGEIEMKVKYVCGFWVATMILILGHSMPSPAGEKAISGDKVATVNGSVIDRGDFNREMDNVQQRIEKQGRQLDDSQLEKVKNETLENLINRELLYQEGKKRGIKIESKAVDDQFGNLKKQFPSEEEFKDTLGKMNLSEGALKSELTRRLTIQKFIEDEIVKKTVVSEKDTKTYYDENPKFFKIPEQVRASHILIKIESPADESKKTQARKKIEQIQQQLRKGEDFAALAKEFSECPSGKNGGDLGYFSRGQMVQPFETTSFSLKTGEVSDIVETRFGFHLIKVVDKKAETTLDYGTAKEKINQYLKNQKIQQEVDQLIDQLKAKAEIKRF